MILNDPNNSLEDITNELQAVSHDCLIKLLVLGYYEKLGIYFFDEASKTNTKKKVLIKYVNSVNDVDAISFLEEKFNLKVEITVDTDGYYVGCINGLATVQYKNIENTLGVLLVQIINHALYLMNIDNSIIKK